MDSNLLIGLAGLVLTIVGFFVVTNVMKNKQKISGNNNHALNQQGDKNSLINTTIGTQINQHLSPVRETVESSPDFPVMTESVGLFSLYDHHKCTQCGRGYKIIGGSTSSIIDQRIAQCPKCGNVDRV